MSGAPTLDRPVIRPARRDDLDRLIEIIAADTLGGHGDTMEPSARPAYAAALDHILGSAVDRLFVVERQGRVVGTAQMTLIVALPHRGRKRAVIEAVQVAPEMRGEGIGSALIRAMIEEARNLGAGVVELTSNAARLDAHRFYERLGFAKSHFGFKLPL